VGHALSAFPALERATLIGEDGLIGEDRPMGEDKEKPWLSQLA
jgi:hypothetical protein